MDGGQRARLGEIMRAARTYSDSLVRLYDELDIMQSYAGSPDYLLARLVVAELVGGVALPAWDGPSVGVLGPEGQPILVFTTDMRDGFRRFVYMSYGRRDEDWLALVVFNRGAPVAAHIVPADRVPAVTEAFRDVRQRHSAGMGLSLYSHCDFLLDALKAEVLGVRTYSLEASDEGGA